MCEFWDKILLGSNLSLSLYKFNKKELIKISEMRKKFNIILGIEVIEDWVFIIDGADSAYFIKYSDKDN